MNAIESNDQRNQDREELADALSAAAGAWARYGLSVGRRALEVASETLDRTARVLGDLADDVSAEGEERGRRLARPRS